MSKVWSRVSLMQGHVDMVTEKNNDVNHDFFTDPLQLQSDGNWLKVHHLSCVMSGHKSWGIKRPTLSS